jgi:glutamate racemase
VEKETRAARKNWSLIIDSGAGAAGVYDWMRAEDKLRGADLIVFADRINFPYGAHEQESLRRLVLRNFNLVKEHVERLGSGTVRALVLASCTASMATADHLRQFLDIPVFDVIAASAVSAIRIAGEIKLMSRIPLSTGEEPGDAIGILATVLTVESRAYRRAIAAMNPDVKVVSEPGYELIRDIQNHDYSPESFARIREGIREKIAFFEERGVGVIVLGCTHFSLFRDLFMKEAAGRMIIVDPTECIITELIQYMEKENILPKGEDCGDSLLFKTVRGEDGEEKLSMVSLPGVLHPDFYRIQEKVERFILSDTPSAETILLKEASAKDTPSGP